MTYSWMTWAYRSCDLKFEQCHAHNAANDDGNARGKILGNVVCVVDDKRNNDTAHGLTDDGCPYDPIVACKKASLCDGLAVLPKNA